jgi:hypothetical protein
MSISFSMKACGVLAAPALAHVHDACFVGDA